jgi:hypothetical protein
MTVAELLRDAADHVARGWIQGYEAIDANGQPVLASRLDAVAWCAYGAMIAASHAPMRTRSPEFDSAEDFIAMAMEDRVAAGDEEARLSYRLWNDQPGRTQGQVVSVLATAAAMAAEAGV